MEGQAGLDRSVCDPSTLLAQQSGSRDEEQSPAEQQKEELEKRFVQNLQHIGRSICAGQKVETRDPKALQEALEMKRKEKERRVEEEGGGEGQEGDEGCTCPENVQESAEDEPVVREEEKDSAEPKEDHDEAEQLRIKSKCLQGNWQEERAVKDIDKPVEGVPYFKLFNHGHKGLLTVDLESKMSDVTTYRNDFRPCCGHILHTKGIKERTIEKCVSQNISKDVFKEFNSGPAMEPMEQSSVTGRDFRIKGFTSTPPQPTKKHNYKTEQPITFWSDHAKKIQGVTEIKIDNSPFKKHSLFTTPIEELMDS
ncbi:sperm associated antigen 8 [Callorhinchus milii]|uniref:Sperm-associated antigen 8-like protein n=2 Tax=Callorhinchus milii TaxID=7868 RepID=A0A4W3J8S9_CALMI|nr:sperm associated antigen 8 [Callorhinchus milii]